MFYRFSQNNTGGGWMPPAITVLVEADSMDEANDRAEEIGIYFDGCEYGRDCSCCGDRWYRTWDDEYSKREEPLFTEYELAGSIVGNGGYPSAMVYYKDSQGLTEATKELMAPE